MGSTDTLKRAARIVFALIIVTATPISASAKTWRVAETESFRVYSAGPEKKLKQLTIKLQQFDQLLRLMTDLKADPPPDKFDIYLVKKSADIRRFTSLGKNVAGFYRATPTGTAAFALRSNTSSGDTSKTWSLTSQQVLFHEYAHHFMLRYFPYPYPPWYVEGFAEYVSTAQFKDDVVLLGDYSRGRGFAVAAGRWLPMETLLSPTRPDLSDSETGLFYAQSWLLTHYLLRDPERQEKMHAFLAKFSSAETLEADFKAAFDMDFKHLKKNLRRYMKGRDGGMTMSGVDRSKLRDVTVTISTLPPSAEDVLLIQAKLNLGIDTGYKDEVLGALETAIKEHEDDLLAQRTWAQAQIAFGKTHAGRARLKALAQRHPGDAQIRFHIGFSHFVDGTNADPGSPAMAEAFKQAKRYFAKAYQRDAAHYPTLYYYYSTLPQPVSPNERRTLEEAAFLAPQVDEIRLKLAQMWAYEGDDADRAAARKILQILSNDPHGGPVAFAARKVLNDLKAMQ
ncbi:MAG: hypothetical protein AAF221_03610 [Pseudomonadota bacterium]